MGKGWEMDCGERDWPGIATACSSEAFREQRGVFPSQMLALSDSLIERKPPNTDEN